MVRRNKNKGFALMLTLKTKVIIPKDVLFHKVGEEMVLLNLVNGKYFSLDDVGADIWSLIVEKGDLDAVHQSLLQQYEVTPQNLEQDLLELAGRLVENELLQIVDP
jgi:hypothetical protein